ncbi:glycosyltransferase family 2 protein [Vibrio diabolicus]|uniref:glycosyltransferase family 2 protein n=1 Tax=Vibrio diabolicus TaxID=50719 RepID=UPI00375170D4
MLNKEPLITVVVPIYNVEKYLSKCIESIVSQSYRNIEVILIDDGSPDKSGDIADTFSVVDNRVKVIHVENSGVSAARNLGIKEARGDYIVFVDADDFLANDYISYMYSIIESTKCDFAISENCFSYPSDNFSIDNATEDKIRSISSEDASCLLMYPGKVDVGCWNKIFNKRFLMENNLYFSERLYMGEGLTFIINAAQVASNIGVGKRRVYFYRKDNISSATTVLSVEKYINAIDAIDNIERGSRLQSDKFDHALLCHKYLTVLAGLRAILIKNEVGKFNNEFLTYKAYLRKHFTNAISFDISIRSKVIMFIYVLSPSLGKLITKSLLYKKKFTAI